MLSRNNLRECCRLGFVGLMTANAQHRDVHLRRLQCGGVVGMLRQRTVASLARHVGMHSLGLYVEDFGVEALWPANMTGFAAISAKAAPR